MNQATTLITVPVVCPAALSTGYAAEVELAADTVVVEVVSHNGEVSC